VTSTPPPHPAAAAAAAINWHLAGSLVSLRAGVNAHWPKRDKASDGGIGDPRHAALGAGSDHNPWLNHTVRAYDFDVDGIDEAWLAEQLRLAGLHGDRRLAGRTGSTDDNGYVILNRHITTPDFSRWVPYDGDPHTGHLHVSVTRDPAGYDDASPWAFLHVPLHAPARGTVPPAAAPAPGHDGPHPGNTATEAPPALPDPHHDEPGFPDPGQDASGHGESYRAQWGNTGPNVAHLQDGMNKRFPRYSHLVVDGVYGSETSAVVQDFAHRIAESDPHCPAEDLEGLRTADGYTVGKRISRALVRNGVI